MTLIAYNFKIFNKSKKINFANESSKRLNYEKILTLNIKLFLSLQSKFTLLKNMRNFSKIFNDIFKIINIQKFDFASNAKDLKKIFENATMKSNVQKFKSLKSIRNL